METNPPDQSDIVQTNDIITDVSLEKPMDPVKPTLRFQLPEWLRDNRGAQFSLLALVLFLAFGVGYWLIEPSISPQKSVSMIQVDEEVEPEVFRVVNVISSANGAARRPNIIVKFNMALPDHHLEEYISITPNIPGVFKRDTSKKEIVFIPSQNFPPGATVGVLVKKGLMSESGKELLDEFYTTFRLATWDAEINFAANNMSGKFFSFDRNQPANIIVEAGTSVINPQVKVYKVTPEVMLESFIYDRKDDDTWTKSGTYVERLVDASNLESVAEYTDIQTQTEIKFQGEPGLYLFQGIDDNTVTSQVWVTLNETGIHFRQDDQNIYLAAQDLKTTQAARDISVSFYSLEDKPTVMSSYVLSGIQSYPFPTNVRLDMIVARKGAEVMVIPVSIPNSQANIVYLEDLNKKHQLFVYTDRPIYRTGAKVAYRGLIRTDNDGLYGLPSVNLVRVLIRDPENYQKYLVNQLVPVKGGGVFAGEIELPKDIKPDQYYLAVTTDIDLASDGFDGDYEYAYFEVLEYTKPSFGLSLDSNQSEVVKGDTIQLSLAGLNFNGTPFANQELKYTVFEKDYYVAEKTVYNEAFNIGSDGMCGGGFGLADEYYGQELESGKAVTLDARGSASISVPTKQIEGSASKELTIVAEKTDEHGNRIVAAKKVIVHSGDFNIFFRPSPSRILTGDTVAVTFYSETLVGDALADTDFKYSIYTENYSGERNGYVRTMIKEGMVRTDAEGVGIVQEQINHESGSVYFAISRQDDRGNTIERSRSFYIRDKADTYDWYGGTNEQTILKVSSRKSNLLEGAEEELTILSPTNMIVLVTFERGRVYEPQWLTLVPGENRFRFIVEEEFVPSITPTFSLFYNGKHYIEGLSLNVPAMSQVINTRVTTDKSNYLPGDEATITIVTTDADNNPIPARIGVGIVDKAIFALRKSTAQPIHSSFYFFRPRRTSSSSSLTWILRNSFGDDRGGGGGAGLPPFQKDADTLYWNPEMVTDVNGTLEFDVPVNDVETTWKVLVYASTNDTEVGQGEVEFVVGNRRM